MLYRDVNPLRVSEQADSVIWWDHAEGNAEGNGGICVVTPFALASRDPRVLAVDSEMEAYPPAWA